ncbi:MAG: DUF5696 domain-containing protein [Candidatus Hydrogenedentales bacterium]|jgi:hypothetical protein
MVSILVLWCQLAAADEFAPRLDTLHFHVERLGAITVPEAQQAAKAEKLAELEARLATGASNEDEFTALYQAIDAARMWLWAHAAEQPARADGSFAELDDRWQLETPELVLRLMKADFAMEVDADGQVWRFEASGTSDIHKGGKEFSLLDAAQRTVEPFAPGYAVGMMITLTEFPDAPGFELRLCANLIGREIVFELAAVEHERDLTMIRWPKAIIPKQAPGFVSVIPRMQGMLLPGDWPQAVSGGDLCNSRSFYMPWWGQLDGRAGVLTILETADDAGGEYSHPEGGPTRIAPRWYPSLGQVRYLRTIRYLFDNDSNYVKMAKRYRRYVQEQGDFVSLAEKRVRTPGLDEVIGRPVVHLGALYHFVQEASLFYKDRIENNHRLQTFDQLADGLRSLKAAGIDKAYVHLDGWGFYGYDNGHPDVLPAGEEQGGWDGLRRFATTCEELDYFFAVHDQYRDFYFNAVSFDDRLAAVRLDGSREETSTWCGGPQTMLNPRFAPGYVRRNHDLFAAHEINVRGAYLDVFAVVPLEESTLPAHPLTRSDCARYRRDCFDLLRARGYVVSSEEPADYLVRSLDLVHHGPYATYPHIGGGDATGIPVPLLNLVYHDSILLPWEMGDQGGWGIPRADAGWLHCLLNAGLPYVGPGASPDRIARVRMAAALAQRLAFQEMLDHELLDGSIRKQRATYADGTTVTVDFDARSYVIEPEE